MSVRKRFGAFLVILSILCSSVSAKEMNGYYLKTDFDDIYMSDGGEYALMLDGGKTVIPVGRYDVDIMDPEQLDKFMMNDIIENETRKSVFDTYLAVSGNSESDSLVMTVFSADLLAAANPAMTTTYNGYPMKADRVYASNVRTGYMFSERGTTAKAIANAVSQVVFYVGGTQSNVIGLGGTLLGIYQAICGTVNTVSATDFTQIELAFNQVSQLTYLQDSGIWYLEYSARRTTVIDIFEHQQFVVNGSSRICDTYEDITVVLQPSDFDTPWATAFNRYVNGMPALSVFNYWKVRNVKYQFG